MVIKWEFELEDGVGLLFDEICFVKVLNVMLFIFLLLVVKVEVFWINMLVIWNRLNVIFDDYNKIEFIGER